MTTLDATLAAIVEQAVNRAFDRAFAAGAPTAPLAAAPDGEVRAEKKPRSSKKTAVADAPASEAVTTTPLPAPAEPPAQAKPSDIDADRARLMEATGKIPDGRKIATELIRKYGPKFDGLSADERASVLAAMKQAALTAKVA